MDIWTKEKRSRVMSRIQGRHTKPELVVRKMLSSMGIRYRLHVGKLPGRPDIVFPSRKKAVFIHGCFWHLHKGCHEGRVPNSRVSYWKEKLEKNVARDKRNIRSLQKQGWKPLRLWECKIEKHPNITQNKLQKFLCDLQS